MVLLMLHFDLKEIPAAGASGTMKMIVTLYEGDDDKRDGTEKSLGLRQHLQIGHLMVQSSR